MEASALRRAREARAARLGPRGLELRELLEEFIEANSDEPIARSAIAAVAITLSGLNDSLAPLGDLPLRSELRALRSQQREQIRGRPGYPSDLHVAGGVLFQADGITQHAHADPIMREIGDPTPVPASVRASGWRIRRGERRALRLADRMLRTVRDRGLWFPPDAVRLIHPIFLWASRLLLDADAVLEKLRPRAVVVFATPNVGPRALIGAARRAGVPSVYFPHSAVLTDPTFNDLPTDRAGVRGPGEADYFAEIFGEDGRVAVTGNASVEPDEMPEIDPALPPVLAPPLKEHQLRAVVDIIGAEKEVVLSPHPLTPMEDDELRGIIPPGWRIWRGATYDLLRQGPPFLIQESSGVGLEAMLLGLPVIELRLSRGRPVNYPFISEPHVPIVSTPGEYAEAVQRCRRDSADPPARQALLSWAARWSQPLGRAAAQRAVGLIEQAASEPPEGPIWDAWPVSTG